MKGTMELRQKQPSTPTLKRPQNRRNFFHEKSPYKQKKEKLTLEDVDGLFDSYDDDDEDLIPPSPIQGTQTSAQLPRGKGLSPATLSNPVLDKVFKSPFKNPASFKASSPIETESDLPAEMERMSPIPFSIEEEEAEQGLQKPTDLMNTFEVGSYSSPEMFGFKRNLAPLMKEAQPQKGSGHVAVVSLEPQSKVPEKKSNGNRAPSTKLLKPIMQTFEVESSPENIALKKNPAPLKKVEAPQQKNRDKPVSAQSQEPKRQAQENQSKIPTLLKKVSAPQQENRQPPIMANRLEIPQITAQEKLNENSATTTNIAALDKETVHRQKPQEPPVEKSSHGGTNFYTFLQTLRETGKSKPAPPMKVCLPIRAPSPPLEEDELDQFWILEPPPLIQLTRKSQSRPRPKQGTTPNAEVKGSADKFSKETQPEGEEHRASGEAGTDHETPPKECAAAGEQPKSRTTIGKELLEIKKGDLKSKAGRLVKVRECIQEPDCAVALQPEEAEHRVSGDAGTDHETPPKECAAAEEQPKSRTTIGKELLEIKKRILKSKAGRRVKARECIQEPDCAVALQSQEPPGKENDGRTRVKSTKDARERTPRVLLPPCPIIDEILNPGGGQKRTSEDVTAEKSKRICSPVEKASSPDRFVSGKRQRKPPGEWWKSHGLDIYYPKVVETQDMERKVVEVQEVDAMKISQRGKVERTQKKPSKPGQKANKKNAAPTKERKKQHRTTGKTTTALSEQLSNQEDQEYQQQADNLNFHPVQSESPLGEAIITTGDCLSNKQASNVAKTIPDHAESRKIQKKKAVTSEVPENDVEIPAVQLQKPNSKNPKIRKKGKMQRMAAFEDNVTPPPPDDRIKHPKKRGKRLFPVQEEQALLTSNVGEFPTVEVTTTGITETSPECWPSKNGSFQNGTSAFAFAKVQGFISGPSSMIALEAHEDTCLPSSGIPPALSASELCVFPLAPVPLQAKDEENITKWFSACWPAILKNAPQMNTDAFQWFSYRQKMIGICEDLVGNNWCVGKMVLGTRAHKPLWVDHAATTVYNILTSAVSVTIDGTASPYNPGLSFAVPCGHAHSITNLTEEPAVLTFTRLGNQSAY